MADRTQQKEQLRREREAREKAAAAAQKRKRMIGYGAGGLVALFGVAALIAFLVSSGGGGGGGGEPDEASVLPDGGSVPAVKVTNLRKAADQAGCVLRASKRGGGVADHTDDIDEDIQYDSDPPTHGRHYVEPAEDGAYEESPPVTQLVHNLEHGRIVIWFKPGISEEIRGKLKALFDDDSYQMVLTPKKDMPYEVAASAWNREPVPSGTGRLLGCKTADDPAVYDAIRDFRDEHRGNGPEAVP